MRTNADLSTDLHSDYIHGKWCIYQKDINEKSFSNWKTNGLACVRLGQGAGVRRQGES